MENVKEHIERRIAIGVVTSQEYLQQIKNVWDLSLIQSSEARKVCMWAWDYFEKYEKPIGKEINSVFIEYAKKLKKDDAEDLENLIDAISVESVKNPINLEYLLDTTQKYFKERRLIIHADTITALITTNKTEEAEKLALSYAPLKNDSEESLDLSDDVVLDRIEKAFDTTQQSLIEYPGALGSFWNSQFVRGGFLALMGSEKKGKSFWLLDIALTACKQKRSVVFFQAGDMTENQQLKRICIYLAKKSDQKRYCSQMYEPVRDCLRNQLNTCDKDEKEQNTSAVWDKGTEQKLREEVTVKTLICALEDYPEHRPCTNCALYNSQKLGIPWLEEVPEKTPLTVQEAKNKIEHFFIDYNRQFKLSSHVNNFLTVKHIRGLLAMWEKQDDFTPDVIIIDYADLLVAETKEFRHGQNEIWKDLRRLSQEKHCLVVTATQADAKSYDQDRLKLANFSEDKRKYAHVTAMYGLNQDKDDREKKIGIMRINEIVIREGEFSATNEVHVLQNLRRGQPCLGSYW